ncbi:MAG: hypothetical protein NTY08_13035 [Proteobacteria bacterium]|nr:hypothetical protein [Pseudomonadota bacterium]
MKFLAGILTAPIGVKYRYKTHSLMHRAPRTSAAHQTLPDDWGRRRISLRDVASWSSGNARATSLILQDGIYVKIGDTARRYLGTFYTTTATTTEDSKMRRFVRNAQNRLSRKLYRTETSASWSHSSSTWRSANNKFVRQSRLVLEVRFLINRANIAATQVFNLRN